MAEDTELTPLDMSFLDSIPHTYRLLASGGIAGCVAKSITAPLSRLTILFQVGRGEERAVRRRSMALLPFLMRAASSVLLAPPQVNSAMHAGERPQYANGLLPAVRRVMREEGFLAFWKVGSSTAGSCARACAVTDEINSGVS